jgi:magnesium chelatase subunit D
VKAADALPATAWADAVRVAALFAVDPPGTGGVVVRALPGPARERWLAALVAALPPTAPLRRVPLHVSDERLLGGLDLAATLGAGRPIAGRGILAEADGGVVLLAMSERLAPAAAARLTLVLDAGAVVLERDGLARRFSTRIGVVALDEGIADDEQPPAALRERLAFHLALDALGAADLVGELPDAAAVADARARLATVRADDEAVYALCAAAAALGIGSIRAPLLALRVARAAAALAGERRVGESELALAARLVLAPRATTLPVEALAPDETPADAPIEPGAGEAPGEEGRDGTPALENPALTELVLAAARTALPDGVLAQLRSELAPARPRVWGAAGARRRSPLRGRRTGVRPGDPRTGARLDVVETLRAAAPWQRLRRSETAERGGRAGRIEVRRDDFRVVRFEQRTETTTIFAVDASGSTALQRLAEAKGAVELLLAECYVRRDRVALVAFRGRGAELLLPPTRSLLRAKRSLAGLPGGGGTPLAAGLEAAAALAQAVARRGGTPLLVLLTDGRANVARDGAPGREQAQADSVAAARLVRASGLGALLVDTSPRPQAAARELARAMGARYLPLPHADAHALCAAVRHAEATPRMDAGGAA